MFMENTKHVLVYTDGSAKTNPGLGGYAAIIIGLLEEGKVTIIAGGNPHSTNNRMELSAVLSALTHLFDIAYDGKIIIRTDSQYISRAVNEGWLENWINNHFKGIKNQDLWLMMWKYLCKLDVKIEWVRGHNDDKFNEMADRLANEACYFQGAPFTYEVTL